MKLKKNSILWSVPLTNMADIAYLLLIFIIIFSLISSQKNYSVLLPTSKSGDDTNKESYKIILTEDLYILDEVIIEDENILKERLSLLDNKNPVTLIASKDMSFKTIKKMIELLRKINFNKIEFLVSG